MCSVVLTSGTWSLGDNLVSGAVSCVVCSVVLTSGTWSLGDNLVSGVVLCGACRLMQCRQVEADICSTGSRASRLVLGTIQVLPRRCIMLLEKSCLMLLTLINMVPPMTGQ